MKENLQILRNDVDTKAAEAVKAMTEGKPEEDIKAAKKAVTAAVNAFNAEVAKEYYKDLAAKHGADAVRVAITGEGMDGPFVPDVIGIQFKATEAGVILINETHPDIQISLPTMQTTIGVSYFHDKDWFARLNVLARLIAVNLNKDLVGSAAYSYIMDEAAKTFELDSAADPTSNKSMVAAFQKVIDGIVWVGETVDKKGTPVNDIKFQAKDWKFIRESMTRHAGVGTLGFASPARCSEYVCEAMHCILRNRGYRLVNDNK